MSRMVPQITGDWIMGLDWNAGWTDEKGRFNE